MDHKMDLINLDFEPPLTDKSSAEEEEEVKLFLGMCSPSTSSHLPSFFLSILLSTQVGKAKGRMASDNAAAPVEWLMAAHSPYMLQSENIHSKNTRRTLL